MVSPSTPFQRNETRKRQRDWTYVRITFNCPMSVTTLRTALEYLAMVENKSDSPPCCPSWEKEKKI